MSKELLQAVIYHGVEDNLNRFFLDASNNYREVEETLSVYDDDRFSNFQTIGEIVFGPSEKLVIVTAEVGQDLTERSGKKAQYEKAKKILKGYMKYDAGIFVFSDVNGSFRFSLVYGEALGVKKVFSSFRRFTYLVSQDQTNRTFLERVGNCGFSSLDELKEAFSVEKVNKEFYKEIASYYYRLAGRNDFEREMVLPSVADDDDRKYEEFAVRLIGRAIFCWFLKHKKSANGVPLMPAGVLSVSAVQNNSNYYHFILEPLFFELMNKPVKDRSQIAVPESDSIPFLNGGLFEPHPNDYYQKAPNWALKIPDGWFDDFFGVLERYNFTIDENSVVDADVSVDPEMMGRIFENLLAEVNPETGETARKATGSYYTPRAIVDYMVEQSLIQYLLGKITFSVEKLRRLLSYEDDVSDFTDDEKNAVVIALKDIKTIDPACGSGAFPMGILHRMLVALEKIDPKLEIWRKQYINSYHPVMRRIIEDKLRKGNEEYVRKLTIIQDSIYGVDIQPIAVEIAKLRCFLSLVVDELVLDNEENRGIEPLPNLEFKFIAANTLIGLPPPKEKQGVMGVSDSVKKLKELRESYLRSFGEEKLQIEMEFRATQRTLFTQGGQWASSDSQIRQKLIDWDPFSYKECGWFDPEWMFGGFDIVIANPPYDVLNITEGQRISPRMLETIRTMPIYKVALGGKLNFFRLFIARAFSLMCRTGVLTYIVPYAFMCDSSAKALREFVLTDKQLKFIEAFPERDDPNRRLFEAVKMSTCIVCIGNTREDALFPVRTHYSREISLGVPTVHVNGSTVKSIDPENHSIPLMSDSELGIVKHMLRNAPSRLVEFGKCYEGEVNLTFHKGFLSTDDSLAPMIKGAAIQRYRILEEMSQGEIQYLNSAAFLKHNTSPKSQHHKFRRIVMQGITGVNEAVRLKMTILNGGTFCGNSSNYILIQDSRLQQKCLLALLNSRLMNWYFKLFSTNSNVNGYQVDNLPVKLPSDAEQQRFVELADRIITMKERNPKADTSPLEREIDLLVYDLYNLTQEEVAIVEGSIRK